MLMSLEMYCLHLTGKTFCLLKLVLSTFLIFLQACDSHWMQLKIWFCLKGMSHRQFSIVLHVHLKRMKVMTASLL